MSLEAALLLADSAEAPLVLDAISSAAVDGASPEDAGAAIKVLVGMFADPVLTVAACDEIKRLLPVAGPSALSVYSKVRRARWDQSVGTRLSLIPRLFAPRADA